MRPRLLGKPLITCKSGDERCNKIDGDNLFSWQAVRRAIKMGPSNAVVILVILVTASASPTSNQAAQEKAARSTTEPKGASEATSTTPAPAVTPVSAKANNGPISSHHQQPLHGSLVRKRSGYMEQLYSEPPGAEMPYYWAGDRRSNDRFVRAPVKRSPMRTLIPRNKRESSADDDALALLALWASAANRDDLSQEPLNHNGMYKFASLLNSLKEAYPQHFYNAEVGQPYENFELGPQEAAEEPEIVLPEEEAYPRYSTWTDPDYVVPERFTVMRRSPGGLLPILPSSYRKRSANLDDVTANGRWGAFAPQRKRFVVAKRSPVSQGDVYSLAQMLGEDQNEQNVPIYRRLML
ncbi:uncharacterized protein LOC135941170 isoform X2 [Cloeon dipterum]|uniref:uncharacterized protein LOC135941170 isoform X2 n=1 Tax=Cloeon dipterum TaxID=197152 RepID=UPI0032207169